ncbi:MAG: hypothetical protein IPL52_01570 [Flavobacteriales bacterium]|nr:hypothetical protein [Flavobacteriales bacterium]
MEPMDPKTVEHIIDAAKFVLPSVVIPLVIIAMNNAHNRKTRASEQAFQLSMVSAEKNVASEFTVQEERRVHEKEVYASMLKILFEVQRLHIDLSGNCVDYKCIDSAVSNFKIALTTYQARISDNQIYLTPEATNELYGFYQQVGDLLTELKEIQDKQKYHLAIASVYYNSRELAMATLLLRINFADVTAPQDEEGVAEELAVKYKNFINCCGRVPRLAIMKEYEEFTPEVAESLDEKRMETEELRTN